MGEAHAPADQPENGRSRLLADVVRDVVAEVAPGELPVAEGLRRLGGFAGARRFTGRDRSRDPLGFGMGDVVPLVTPVVWIVVDECVRQSADGLAGAVRRWLHSVWCRVSRRNPAVLAVPPLSPSQLVVVGQRVRDLALESGIQPEQAVVLAERVVARLVLPGTQGAPTGQSSAAAPQRVVTQSPDPGVTKP